MDDEVGTSAGRLVIRELELENFKSYGGKVCVGPFHKRFSAIVGPNGSGKSNVIDGMLFVFGKRAKQMRLAKISELIHKSDTYPNADSATVSVLFHEIRDTGPGDEDYEVVPGSELAVARTAFRNNTSKYSLNGTSSTFTQVTDLFRAKGVDLNNNRFLILQGEVEQIAMMKPKAPTQHEDGLLEYLEDIVGSHTFKEPIAAAVANLETLNETRTTALHRAKAVEADRDALLAAKDAAEEYLVQALALAAKRATLYAAHRADARMDARRAEAKLGGVRDKLRGRREAVAEEHRRKEELEKAVVEAERERAAVVGKVDRAKDEMAELERRDIQMREGMKHLKAKEKKLGAAMRKETTKAEDAENSAGDADVAHGDASSAIIELGNELQDAKRKLETEYERVRVATSGIRDELEKHKTKLLPFREVVQQKVQVIETLEAERALIEERVQAPIRHLEERESKHKQVTVAIQGSNDQLRHLSQEKSKTQTEITTLERKQQQLTSEGNAATKQLGQLQASIDAIKATVAQSSSRSRLVSALLDATRKGHLRGVIGQLRDLGAIDDKYDLAVGAAAGAHLASIVVDTAENAQKCVEHLRRHTLGRATFIILEKLGYLESRMNAASAVPNAQRLFDMVEVSNPRYRPAFYFALNDTLVAPNLSEGGRLAFQPTRRHRVVTLSGELIEVSGAMSGGGGAPPRARLGSSTADPAEAHSLPEIEKEAARLGQTVSSLNDALLQTERALSEAKSRVSSISLEVRKIDVQKGSQEQQLKELSATLPKLRKAASVAGDPNSSDSKRLKELEHSKVKAEADLADAKNEAAGLEAVVAEIQQRIRDAGGRALAEAKESVSLIESQLDEQQRVKGKAQAQAETARSTAKKARAASEKARRELEAVASELVQKKAAYDHLEEEGRQAMELIALCEKELGDKADVVSGLRKQVDVLVKELSEFRKLEVDLEDEIEGLEKVVRSCAYKVEEAERKLQTVERQRKSLEADAAAARGTARPSADHSGGREVEDESAEGDPMDVDGPGVCEDEAGRLDLEEQTRLGVSIRVLEEELSKMEPNLDAIQEYRKKNEEYNSRVGDLDEITQERDDGRVQLETLRKNRLDTFMSGFSIITSKLKEMYQMITLGGDAELELVDSLDPFSEGIEFSVRPPKKSWKNISNLSGGEKTLSSLALVFALHHFKPTPLYFMDEIDAALDFKNVSIVANYVKERTKNAQFIIISLRNNMFELADRLVGIYKTHNTTKSVTINPNAFVIPSQTSIEAPQ